MQKDPNNSNNTPNSGGSGSAGSPPKKEAKKSSDIVIELNAAKDKLYTLVRQLGKPKSDNILKKLDEANEELHTFSQGGLIKQIEEQHKKLKEEILAEANLQTENQKQTANDALQHYFNKRLELARVRQQEINQEDKQMMDAANYICSFFDTPEGIRQLAMNEADQKKQSEMLNKVLSELGNKHSHITRTEPGIFFNKKHVVNLVNGMYTSESPVDLAMTVKAHGHNDFEFSTGSTEKGGWVLRQSIKEMLKIGIKDISLTKELREKMYTPRRANNFADAVLEGRRTLNYFEMEELRQLERICSASRSAYNDIKGNNIFDNKGELKANAKYTPEIVHQANTFMRLSEDADRLAYLNILFPVNKDIEFNKFVAELESRQPKITLDGLTPKEYFEQKMMWRWSRNAFNASYRKEQLINFNKDTLTSDDRKKLYAETKDGEQLSMYAGSEKLSNQDRIDLIKASFENVQEGKSNQIGLYTHPILRSRSVSGDDMKKFIDRTLPLFKNILVKAGNAIDYNATTQDCLTLMTELRDTAKVTFATELHANNPKAFENFYKNKLLLDELEKHVHEYLHNTLIDKQVREEIGQDMSQYDQKVSAKQTELKVKLSQSFTDLKNNPSQAATYFNTYLRPEMQLSAWLKLSPADTDDAAVKASKLELRAHILSSFIGTQATANSTIGSDYAQKFLTPLMQTLTPEESESLADKLKELLLANNNHGCNKQQNDAINLARGFFNDKSEIESLSPAALFKAHYITLHDLADKERLLLERIKYLVTEKPSNMFQGWMFNRSFDAEMKDLLFTGNTPKDDTADMIETLKTDPAISGNSDIMSLIERIDRMQPKTSANATASVSPKPMRRSSSSFDFSAVLNSNSEGDTESVELNTHADKDPHTDKNHEPKSAWVGVD